jgi:hypothetical protein
MMIGIALGESESFLDDFEFEEKTLVYHDAPIVGFLVHKGSGERFAFFCKTILEGRLYHWSLVPRPMGDDAEEVIRKIDAEECPVWASVVEDRRANPRCTTVLMKTAEIVPHIG